MTLELRFTEDSRHDLRQIGSFIAGRDLSAAQKVLDRIEERCFQVGRNPWMGRPRPDIADDARALLSPPYVIFYRVEALWVEIVRVVDGRRDLSRMSWPA